jgi:hypothetical protein
MTSRQMGYALGCSSRHANRILNRLVEQKVAYSTGSRSKRIYHHNETRPNGTDL